MSVCAMTVAAAPLPEPDRIPHVDRRGREAFSQYLHAGEHRAFAVAPGGAWGWMADQPSTEAALSTALRACAAATEQPCLPYAVGDRVVLDGERWRRAWREQQETWSETPLPGTGLGERFPDLAFGDASGQSIRISDFRGRLLIVHFWASWCPPCMRELPVLSRFSQRLTAALGERAAIVLLQVREPADAARRWLEANDLDGLPLYDSGNNGEGATRFRLADGETIADREIAARFPTSYILDQQGRILLRHVGPIERWDEYLPLLTPLLR